MPVITCIDDLKRIYARRVPRMFYDYAESGSWTEQTFRENESVSRRAEKKREATLLFGLGEEELERSGF